VEVIIQPVKSFGESAGRLRAHGSDERERFRPRLPVLRIGGAGYGCHHLREAGFGGELALVLPLLLQMVKFNLQLFRSGALGNDSGNYRSQHGKHYAENIKQHIFTSLRGHFTIRRSGRQREEVAVGEYNQALKTLIKARFGSEAEMARQVGRSRQSINKMTRKGRSPKISELNWLAEVLGVSVATVVDAFQTAQ